MRSRKKCWLSLALCTLACAGLTACGQPADSTPAPSESAPAASESAPAPTVYENGGQWFKVPDELNPKSVDSFAGKLRTWQETYLTPDNAVYFALIPDKTQLQAEPAGPVLDGTAMAAQLEGQLGRAQVIDLTGALTLEDFYKADGHWRQEALQPVLDALGGAMGFAVDLSGFEAHSHPGFVGAYTSEIPAGSAPEEELVYLTSPATESAVVDHFQGEFTQVYDTARLDTDIPYDVYLSGATPLVTITCPDAATDRELVIFRDSFGSSLAPLLCGQYRTITLVDLRYIVSGMLPQYVDFTNQDVLFLYSAAVVNRSAMLR